MEKFPRFRSGDGSFSTVFEFLGVFSAKFCWRFFGKVLGGMGSEIVEMNSV
jgi:hypothetical protein